MTLRAITTTVANMHSLKHQITDERLSQTLTHIFLLFFDNYLIVDINKCTKYCRLLCHKKTAMTVHLTNT